MLSTKKKSKKVFCPTAIVYISPWNTPQRIFFLIDTSIYVHRDIGNSAQAIAILETEEQLYYTHC